MENSASRAGSRCDSRIGSPALSGTSTRCPTGSFLTDPSSSTFVYESVTNLEGTSRIATISRASSTPSATSRAAQRTRTVFQSSRMRFCCRVIAAYEAAPASNPNAIAMSNDALPEGTPASSREREAARSYARQAPLASGSCLT